jgi:hypothetical protein
MKQFLTELLENPSPRLAAALERQAEAQARLEECRNEREGVGKALAARLNEAAETESALAEASAGSDEALVRAEIGKGTEDDLTQAARLVEELTKKKIHLSQIVEALRTETSKFPKTIQALQAESDHAREFVYRGLSVDLAASIVNPDLLTALHLLLSLRVPAGHYPARSDMLFDDLFKANRDINERVRSEMQAAKERLSQIGKDGREKE